MKVYKSVSDFGILRFVLFSYTMLKWAGCILRRASIFLSWSFLFYMVFFCLNSPGARRSRRIALCYVLFAGPHVVEQSMRPIQYGQHDSKASLNINISVDSMVQLKLYCYCTVWNFEETSWGWAGPSSDTNWDLPLLWLTIVTLYWLIRNTID